jgi:hypothetical protein
MAGAIAQAVAGRGGGYEPRGSSDRNRPGRGLPEHVVEPEVAMERLPSLEMWAIDLVSYVGRGCSRVESR